jgi:choline dehydrogenase-like flavoprotein
VGVTAVFDEDVFGWRGTLQPFFMDEFRESHGLMFEVTSPLPGASASALPGLGVALKDALADYRKVASVGLFVADSSSGRVRRLPGGAPLVTYALNAEDTRRLLEGIAMAAKIFFAAGARRVYPGVAEIPELRDAGEISRVTQGGWKASSLPIVGFHPLGTARMGRGGPRTCAVDPWGESHELPGLYVADASILPGCPGVNPQITIMAMATRIAARLAERMGAHGVPVP